MTHPSHACCNAHAPAPLGRRSFVKLAALGAGMTLLHLAPTRVLASGKAEALVLSCMDYRLADNVHAFMDSLGMTDKYDHLVVAGASAGVTEDKFADWHETFWSHLDVAIDLHGIHKLIVIDHRDCGAYKLAFGPESAADPETETSVHRMVMTKLHEELKTRKPELAFEAYLMALDGTVERIPEMA